MASPEIKFNKGNKDLNELYTTPVEALDQLFGYVNLNLFYRYLDPCDGTGIISNYLKDKGATDVITNELFADTYKTSQDHKVDFLNTDTFNDMDINCIVMNPPFTKISDFVEKALEVSPRVFVYSRLTFLESLDRHERIFKKGHLHNIYLLVRRVGCPKGFLDEAGDVAFHPPVNAVAYAWYEIRRESVKSPQFHWLV